jgi:hypothetical protein
LGKVFVALHIFIRSYTFLAYKNFLERWEGVPTENLKRQSTTKRKRTFSSFKIEISEMKQTAALMLGILGLGAIFVQLNEII